MGSNDEQIKKDAVEQLTWDNRVDASNIHVDVIDGIVTLSGVVSDYTSVLAAVEDVDHIKGVKSVNNNLSIQHPSANIPPDDEQIEENLRQLLQWNPRIDPENIRVSVHNAVATLEGEVDAYWKKERAGELAYEVVGVVNVLNRLIVKSSLERLDKKIVNDIYAALRRNSFVDENKVNIKVEDGVVTITGTAPDWPGVKAASVAAKYTPGVVDVNNRLEVKT